LAAAVSADTNAGVDPVRQRRQAGCRSPEPAQWPHRRQNGRDRRIAPVSVGELPPGNRRRDLDVARPWPAARGELVASREIDGVVEGPAADAPVAPQIDSTALRDPGDGELVQEGLLRVREAG